MYTPILIGEGVDFIVDKGLVNFLGLWKILIVSGGGCNGDRRTGAVVDESYDEPDYLSHCP